MCYRGCRSIKKKKDAVGTDDDLRCVHGRRADCWPICVSTGEQFEGAPGMGPPSHPMVVQLGVRTGWDALVMPMKGEWQPSSEAIVANF